MSVRARRRSGRDRPTCRPATCRRPSGCGRWWPRRTSASSPTRTGENSKVYPALARVPSELFGICVVGTSGNVYAVGDAEYEFTIMSVSKPFVFALVCEALGVEEVRERIGVNATGLAFNSLEGIERNPDGRTNPMVNSGAIATTSLVPGADPRRPSGSSSTRDCRGSPAARCRSTTRCTPRPSETNYRNQSIARLLQSYGRDLHGPGRGGGSLHQAVLAERERQGPGGDGRHAGRRRGEPDHQGAGGRTRPSATTRWP